MLIIVLANEHLKTELLAQGIIENAQVIWITEPSDFLNHHSADAYMDLLFENNTERIKLFEQLKSKPVFVSAVISVAGQLPPNFIRFNGWNTFLKRSVIEAAYVDESMKATAEQIFSVFNKKVEWVADMPGFITARVIAMIINEAYFALDEKVSSKEEIDTAMKLGTNYPYGPFEWSEMIGLKNIYTLLSVLSKTNSWNIPAALLKKEALL